MTWFKKIYPDSEVEESASNSYLLQTLSGMQGKINAGRSWYIQLKDTLEGGYGMVTCPAEPALFVKFYPGGYLLLVCTSKDDLLCVPTKEYVFADYIKFIDSILPVTTQIGTVLKYISISE